MKSHHSSLGSGTHVRIQQLFSKPRALCERDRAGHWSCRTRRAGNVEKRDVHPSGWAIAGVGASTADPLQRMRLGQGRQPGR